MTGVSFVIPVHNAGPGLLDTVRSVLAQADSASSLEIVLVDDRSADDSVTAARRAFPDAPLVVVPAHGMGAAAALNRGLDAAHFALIAQVDQDVVLEHGWLEHLVTRMDADDIAAVQGQYVTDPNAGLFARIMGRDLQERYASLSRYTGHACTGNVLYRAGALRAVGGFDESLGYGYDNDMSYRLCAAGLRLLYCAEARSRHQWREGLFGYARQQYGFGYGRLDLVAKHRDRVAGDSVSPALMMLHPIVTAAAIALAGCAVASGPNGTVASAACVGALGLLALLALERAVAGTRAAVRFGDWVPLLFPLAHLVRDLVWVWAILVWSLRRMAGIAVRPGHSMKPRTTSYAEARAGAAPVIEAGRSVRADSRARRARWPSSAL
jgi:hypothetical protein